MRKAEDFILKDQHGKEFNLFENLDSPVMLVFYPKDDSLVCSKQLCDYNDNFENFRENGIKVVGISTDGLRSHQNFAEKYNLKFPLLSDTEKKVSKAFDALNLLGTSKRKIVLINRRKEIVYENTLVPIFYKKSEELLNDKILKSLKED